MNNDRPMLGIALMAGFCLLAPMSDAIAKLLGGTVPLGELLLVRFAMQVLLLLPIVLWFKYPLAMTRRVFALVVLRSICHILGIGGMYSALRFLPLADTIAIAFVMPFIMMILGYFVLGEEVGSRRIIACGVGFIGTLLVVQPSFIAVGAPALLPLLVAVVFSIFMIITRFIAKEINPISLQVVGGTQAVIMLAVIFFFARDWHLPALDFKMPELDDSILLFVLGVIGTISHLLMTWSLRYAPSATLAPMQYLEIPFATFIGWLLFKDLPNGLAALGIVITMAAGLYIVFREQKIAANAAQN